MGETGMEMQFRDGANGQIIAECRDTQIGRKYAATSMPAPSARPRPGRAAI
jgi:hypothetical protein